MIPVTFWGEAVKKVSLSPPWERVRVRGAQSIGVLKAFEIAVYSYRGCLHGYLQVSPVVRRRRT